MECKYCHRPLEQRPGGRRREYCDDACRQRAHRLRQGEAAAIRAEQEIESWGVFLPATVKYLAGLLAAGNWDTARKLANLMLAEQDFSRRKKPRDTSDRAELEQARADLSRIRQDRAREAEQLRALLAKRETALAVQAKVIEDLESKIEQERRGSAQVQEQCRQIVATLNMKLGRLAEENHTLARENLNLARQVAELDARLAESRSEQVEALTIQLVELEQENIRLKRAQS